MKCLSGLLLSFILSLPITTSSAKAEASDSAWNRAADALRAGRNEEAIALYLQIASEDPTNHDVYNNLAIAKHALGDYQMSIEYLDMALRYYPIKQYVTLLRKDGTRESWDPELSRLLMNRGYNKQLLGRTKEALSDYNSSARTYPLYEKVFLNRGWLYRKLGDYKNALKDYTTAIGINDKNGSTYVYRASVYARLGDLDNTCKDLKVAVSFDHQDAKNNYVRLTRDGICH